MFNAHKKKNTCTIYTYIIYKKIPTDTQLDKHIILMSISLYLKVVEIITSDITAGYNDHTVFILSHQIQCVSRQTLAMALPHGIAH